MKTSETLEIDFTISPEAPIPLDKSTIVPIIFKVLAYEGIADEAFELHIQTYTSDAMQLLNAKTRGKDKTTNVLSFTYEGPNPTGRRLLGDIVICPDVIIQEAETQNKSLADHTTHMLVHALLHLLGYDHESNDEANTMEAIEIAILAHFNIANPYEDQCA